MEASLIRPFLASLGARGARFDTHAVEFAFRDKRPLRFRTELARFDACDDPVHRFSAWFGRWMLDTFADVLEKLPGKVRSTNLRGAVSANQEWKLRGRGGRAT